MPLLSAPQPRSARAMQDVRAELVRRIDRHWKPGQKVPSIRELAETLGCSYRNTHAAVQQLVREGMFFARERVGVFVAEKLDRRSLGEAGATGESPHVARPLAGLRVAVYAQDLHGEAFVMRMREAFEREMLQHDINLHHCTLPPHVAFDIDTDGIDAVAIFHPQSGPVTVAPNVPVVAVSHGFPQSFAIRPASNYDMVSIDHHHGGVLAGEHARRAGVTRPCFLGRQMACSQKEVHAYDRLSTDRLAGFETGYAQPIRPVNRLIANSYSISHGALAVCDYLKLDPRPDGIFTASDDLALGFVCGAISQGLQVGRDYKMIGFDGQRLGRTLNYGPLTTIDVPSEQMGIKAAGLLTERMLHANLPVRRLHLGCRLFEGATM